MAVVATGQISIVDVQDGQALSCVIQSSQPRIQIKDVNALTYAPDWEANNVVLMPVIYCGSVQLQPDNPGLSYEVRRRPATGVEGALLAGETWDNHVLTLSTNVLANADNAPGGMITYVFRIGYTDPNTLASATVVATIDFALVQTGADGVPGTPGSPGAPGTAGADAVHLTLYAPAGDVFKNQSGQLTIQAAAYVGTTALTTANADFTWWKYVGSWQPIAGQTGTSLTVYGSEVVGLQAYQCQMRYPKMTGQLFSDVYTLTDKTDSYQAQIESTGGNVFKNTVGTTVLICRAWQNGVEADPVKTTLFAQVLPTTGLSTGIFCYKINPSTQKITLWRYNGSAWQDVTSDATYKHTKTYTWHRRDKDGNALDGGGAFTATSMTDPKAVGKVIYIDGDDVDGKTTFTCEVS